MAQAVRSNVTIAGALETLVARGLVPDDWLEANIDRRAFAPLSLCGECERGFRPPLFQGSRPRPWVRCAPCNRSADACARSSLPLMHEDLIAFALDPQGIETAERLAIELFARVPDVERRAPRVLWRCVERDGVESLLREWRRGDREYNQFDELSCLANDVIEPVERARVARGELPYHVALPTWLVTAPALARTHLRAAAILRAAQLRAGVRAREAHEDGFEEKLDALIDECAAVLSEDVAWAIASGCDDLATLAHERNPFEPVMALWKLGIAVQSVTTQTVVLVLLSERA